MEQRMSVTGGRRRGSKKSARRPSVTRMSLAAAICGAMCAAIALVSCDDGSEESVYAAPATWTAIDGEVFGNTELYKVAYGNGRWVISGKNSKTWFSANNGATWTESESSGKAPLKPREDSADNLSGLAFGGGYFVVTGGSGGNIARAYSRDGDTWTDAGSTNAFNAKGVVYGGGKWLVGGGAGKIAYAAAPTGAWTSLIPTETENVTTFWKSNGFINALAYGGGKFVAAGSNYGHTAYSPNGIYWQSNTQTEEIFGSTWINGVAYGAGKFVVVGEGGGIAAWSGNGIDWTQMVYSEDNPKFGNELLCVAYGGEHFAAGDKAGNLFYAKDGLNWKKALSTTFEATVDSAAAAINGAAYGAGRFIIVGSGGKAACVVVEQ